MCALYGGIEAGGTKFVCAVGSGPHDLRDIKRIPTTTPSETIGQVIEFFKAHGTIAAVGIAAFGPVDLDMKSPTFGYITSTPKPGWAFTDLAGLVGRALKVHVGFDTDVNGAALGEHRWGAAQDLDNFIYLTIGTGIGGGGMVNGKLMHGLVHPEMGHIRIPMICRPTLTRGTVPSTTIVLKDWPTARRCRNAGGSPPKLYPRTIQPGNWKRAILRSHCRITSALYPRRN